MYLFRQQITYLITFVVLFQGAVLLPSPTVTSAHAETISEARRMLQTDQEYDLSSVFVKYKNEDSPRLLRVDPNDNARFVSTASTAYTSSEIQHKKQQLEDTIVRLLDDPEIEHVQPQFIYEIEAWTDSGTRSTPNDFDTTSPYNHWYYDQSNLRELWDDQDCATGGGTCGGDSAVTVAVIDTGLAFENYDSPWGDKFRVNQVLEREDALASSSGNTLNAASSVFTASYVGNLIYNGTDDTYAEITAVGGSPSATATVELFPSGDPIGDSFDGDEFDILGQGSDMFTYGAPVDDSEGYSKINIYTNGGETLNNGIDDDSNGFIDDVYGVNTADYVYCNFITTCTSTQERSIGHANDDGGHGTYVTGLVASLVDNGFGSVSPAHNITIMPIKASFYHSRSLGSLEIWYAVDYAVNNGADVINMSFSGPAEDVGLTAKIEWANENNVAVVAASGNADGGVEWPAKSSGSIAVGAARPNNERAFYSNYGPELDVVAYVGNGTSVGDTAYQRSYSCFFSSPNCYTTNEYNSFTNGYGIGTSYASPQVAALAALLRTAKSTITPEGMRQELIANAIDLGPAGFDNETGWGAIDFEATYDRVLNNVAPTFQISEPNGVGDNADMFFTVTWTDSDADDDAEINLYWDEDGAGFDGTLIDECSNLSENGADSCDFDTRGLPAESYYIYGCITDNINSEVCDYGSGAVSVSHSIVRDSGKVGVGTTPLEVRFNETFTGKPLVFATVSSEAGNDQVFVNVTNITSTGFRVSVKENTVSGWDGTHLLEEVSWYAVSAISAGEQVGAMYLNTDWESVTFNTPFGSAPHVFAMTQTEAGDHLVHVDINNVTTTGFDMRLEEEAGYDGEHVDEYVGWVAFLTHPSAGVQADFVSADNNWTTVNFGSPYSDIPVLLAEIQEENGGDIAQVDIRNLTKTGFQIRVEEDKFIYDPTHVTEEISWVAFPKTAPDEVFEKATVNSTWEYVEFLDTFDNKPYVFGDITSEAGDQTAELDIRNVTRFGFEARIEEDTVAGWDGTHLNETVSVVAVDPVNSSLDKGKLAVDHNWTSVSFSGSYGTPPNVFAMIQTESGAHTAEVDIKGITTSGFQIRVEEDVIAGWDGTHVPEQVAWFAVDSASPPFGQTGSMMISQVNGGTQWVTKSPNFSPVFAASPNLIFEINSENGDQTVQADVKLLNTSNFQVRLEEEPNRYDGYHITEKVVWFANDNIYTVTNY